MFKKRIGVSQRITKKIEYDEVVNSLDVNWVNLLTRLEILCVPLPLMPADSVKKMWKELKLDGLILSGGNTLANYADENDKPENISIERDLFENALLEEAVLNEVPILGVCRGMQVINVFFDGKLNKIKGHAGTRHQLITEELNNGFHFPSEVNSFHNFSIPRKCLGKNLLPLAYDNEDNIEAFYNQKKKIIGIMWHPEREVDSVDSDCKLIKNHFQL